MTKPPSEEPGQHSGGCCPSCRPAGVGGGQGRRGGVTGAQCLHRRWPYGSEGCQAHGFQGFVTALASICSSAAIAWGRYHHYCTRTSWSLGSQHGRTST